jgi:hypothetical protein
MTPARRKASDTLATCGTRVPALPGERHADGQTRPVRATPPGSSLPLASPGPGVSGRSVPPASPALAVPAVPPAVPPHPRPASRAVVSRGVADRAADQAADRAADGTGPRAGRRARARFAVTRPLRGSLGRCTRPARSPPGTGGRCPGAMAHQAAPPAPGRRRASPRPVRPATRTQASGDGKQPVTGRRATASAVRPAGMPHRGPRGQGPASPATPSRGQTRSTPGTPSPGTQRWR